jgi:hypothetical protein
VSFCICGTMVIGAPPAVDGVAVLRRAGGYFGADGAAGAAAIFNDEGLVQRLRQAVGNQTRDHVGDAARTVRHDDLDRMARPILCARGERTQT